MAVNLSRLVADSRFRRAPFLLFCSAFLALNLLVAKWQSALERSRRANLLVPEEQVRQYKNARYDRSVGQYLGAYLKVVPDATKQPLVILAGMSQMYVINDQPGGGETISEHLDDYYRQQGIRVFGLAAPNMDNEEAVLELLAAVSRRQTKPTVFIYGVCFDKFRNIGVRPDLQNFMKENPAVLRLWHDATEMARSRYPAAGAMMSESSPAQAAAAAPVADASFESRLRNDAGVAIPLVKSRSDLNAYVQDRLYTFRNFVLGISNTTKRPIIKSRYDVNREFLGLLADVAEAHGVRLVMYNIPLNPQAETPYVPEQYEEFKQWLTKFAHDRSIPFANLESSVPIDQWGLRNGSPDFKHFNEIGHQTTAEAIRQEFDSVIRSEREIATTDIH